MNRAPDERWRHVQRLCEVLDAVEPEDQSTRLRMLERDDGVRREVLGLLQARADEETQQQLAQRGERRPGDAFALPLADRVRLFLTRHGAGRSHPRAIE